jgi:hypothetical protein
MIGYQRNGKEAEGGGSVREIVVSLQMKCPGIDLQQKSSPFWILRSFSKNLLYLRIDY